MIGPADSRWRTLLVLAVILAVAVALRVNGIARESSWVDETLDMEITLGNGFAHEELPQNQVFQTRPLVRVEGASGLHGVIRGVERSGHPPLYFLLLRGWVELFGDGEAAARSLSTAASTLTIFLLFFAVAETAGTTAGLVAAALCALAGTQIEFAQEARNYALVVVFALGASLAVLRIRRSGPSAGRFTSLALCALAMMLTHYFAIGWELALALFVAVELRGKARVHALAALAAAGVAFFALWIPVVAGQFTAVSQQSAWLGEPGGRAHLAATLLRALSLPARYMTPAADSWAFAPIAGAILLLPVVVSLRKGRRSFLWALAIVFVIAAVATFDLARSTKQLSYVRYTFFAAAPLYAVLASIDQKWVRFIATATVIATLVATLPFAYVRKPDYRGTAAMIDAIVPPGEPVVFAGVPGRTSYAPTRLLCVSRYWNHTRLVALASQWDARFLQSVAPYRRIRVAGHLRWLPPPDTSPFRLTAFQPMPDGGALFTFEQH